MERRRSLQIIGKVWSLLWGPFLSLLVVIEIVLRQSDCGVLSGDSIYVPVLLLERSRTLLEPSNVLSLL